MTRRMENLLGVLALLVTDELNAQPSIPALAGSTGAAATTTPRPGARPTTAKRNTNRGGRPGGPTNRTGGGGKRH